jgi:hypothetical protein
MKKTRSVKLLVTVALVLALSMVANLGWAAPTVLPPSSNPYGKTYGEWEAIWWQWELVAPVNQDPVSDTTGKYAYANQPPGPVFFLAGTFGGGPVVRNVSVPAGKAFFFPVSNWILTNPEDVPAGEPDPLTWMKSLLNSVFDPIPAADLVAVVDGVTVQNYRFQSDPFHLNLPPDCASVTSWLSLQGLPYQPGDHYPNVSDGYWVMLAPLDAGLHEITINYPADKNRSYIDVTYKLSVVPLPSTLLLLGSGFIGLLGIRRCRRQ